MIQGYTGQLDMWFTRQPFEPTMIERLDAMFAAGDCPDAIVVFVDAWTSLRRLAVPQLHRHRPLPGLPVRRGRARSSTSATRPPPSRDHRGLTGKSSGGYGAMVVPMLRPDVFGALASHAGDALFEACYLPEFPAVARTLRDEFDGSCDVFFERLARGRPLRHGTASARSRSTATRPPTRPTRRNPGKALLPFDVATGRLIDDVWAQWLEKDPVRMAPAHADALRSMRRIYLDAGHARRVLPRPRRAGVRRRAGQARRRAHARALRRQARRLTYRYPGAIRELVLALQ